MSTAAMEPPAGLDAPPTGHGITLGEAVRVWTRIAALGEERFLHALN